MVKLVVGVLGQRVGLDFVALKPRRVVEGKEKEIEVVARGLLLLAFLEGWDGGMGWEDVGIQPFLPPRSRNEKGGTRKREREEPTKNKTVAESPPSTVLSVPLTPIVSPRRSSPKYNSLSSSSTSPIPTKRQTSSPTVHHVPPPLSNSPHLHRSPSPPRHSSSSSSPNDSITRLTAPEEWNRRRIVETDALERAISRLVE
ncbi:hypothetical protein BDY24DRAFT_388893 [Mrakia frigida]|uniref:uncharacterized protein n=1 Tax=Mrakia frigida TaxID=29902 RepID=UPI003FCC0B6E